MTVDSSATAFLRCGAGRVCAVVACFSLSLLLLACGTARDGASVRGAEESRPVASSTASAEKVTVDAFLFDVTVREKGKNRSFRLDVYFADSIALLTARGYVGKGIARGVWRADSSLFYFPAEHTYFRGTLDSLVECQDSTGVWGLQDILPGLLRRASMGDDSARGFRMVGTGERGFTAIQTMPSCPYAIALEYLRGGSEEPFYLSEFSYEDQSAGREVNGKRRTIKRGAKLPASRFVITIPEDATPISFR